MIKCRVGREGRDESVDGPGSELDGFNCSVGNMASSHWGYIGAINIESKIEFQDSTPSKSLSDNEYIKYKALSILGTYTQVKQTDDK